MKNFRSTHFPLILTFCFAGALPLACGKGTPQKATVYPLSSASLSGSTIHTASLDESLDLIDEASIRCEDRQNCPPGVGMLLAATGEELGSCSAFLISPTLLMTNSHCIPQDLKAPHTPANGRLRMIFPETLRDAEEILEVEEMIQASFLHANPDILESQDYAFLKLATPAVRKPLQLSIEGVSDGLTLTNIRMTPQSLTLPLGLLQVTTCKAHQRTYFLPGFWSHFSPVISFSDCDIVHGNSGSPLLDAEGKVRALVHAFLSEPVPPMLLEQVEGKPKQINSGTNLACVITPLEIPGRLLPVNCKKEQLKSNSAAETKAALLELDRDRARQLTATIRDWKAEPKHRLPASFSWEIVKYEALDSQTSLKPTCRNADAASSDVLLPVWDSGIRMNPYFQFQTSLTRSEVHAHIEVSTLTVKITVKSAENSNENLDLFEGELPLCSEKSGSGPENVSSQVQ